MKNNSRNYTFLDQLIMQVDNALKTLTSAHQSAKRTNPAEQHETQRLSFDQKRDVIGMMRINHVGEVCAQALYQGQALTARDHSTREKMQSSADEEIDHLAWCEERLNNLKGHTSYLNPFWYTASWLIGVSAGIAGDKWSLGFIVETEKQVVRHLENHLARLPSEDLQSRAILEQMKIDETEHATKALDAGGAELPGFIKQLMGLMSKVMTNTAYWV